ncbi:MAG: aminotransferase class I/II-fold pyridoxal phosphate-dependent enzyme, partial [Paramuribaculum sp.]|nr:aminotransferase class I/II-fold pyridoxal phosphate-dependent enzyme [Paramuribaculum sp.]
MSRFDFDKFVDRSNSCAMKYHALHDLFGRKDLTPFWIADMEFEVTPEISEALDTRFSHKVLGYESVPASFKESIISWLGHRHNLSVSAEEIAFVPGIVRGIGYAINYFTRPGDGIVIQPPVYHPFRLLTEGNGRVVINNPLVQLPDGS